MRELLLLGEECADVEAVAATASRGLEPAAYALGAVDEFFDVGQLALGEGLKLFVGGLARVGCVQEDADVVEPEAGALGDVDDGEPGERVLAVAALTADAWRLRQHPVGLVGADPRGVEPGVLGELADGEPLVVQ